MRRKPARAVGPYPHGRKWRVFEIGSDGTRTTLTVETEAEGIAYVATFNRVADHRTVDAAVTEYLEYLRTEAKGGEGLRPSSLVTARYRLRAFLRLTERDIAASDLNPAAGARLYQQRARETKPDTHRGELKLATAFGAWCIERRYFAINPFAGIKPVGRRSTGKAQLRVDEARSFLNAALADDSPVALAVALLLLLGVRASEVCDRVVRDVDDGGKLLWIPSAKTRAGVRQIQIPEAVQAGIQRLIQGKEPSAPLFPELNRHALHYHVRRLCRVAGVPEVCPHGLRGLHATIAIGAGVSVDHVARALGHAGTAVTRRHYIGAGAEESAGVDRVLRVLDGGLSEVA